MLRKILSIFIVFGLSISLTSSAFAAFANLDLVRVVTDRTPGSTLEIATNLGNINTLAAMTSDTVVGGGTSAFTNFTNGATLSNLNVTYFAVDKTSALVGTLFISAQGFTNAAPPTTAGASNAQNKLATNGGVLNNPVLAYYNTLTATGTTVVANSGNVGSMGGHYSLVNLGAYGGFAQSFQNNANLNLALLETAPIATSIWRFGPGNVNTAFTGVRVLDLTTNADGSTTIVAPVTKTTPTITWANPADITYGTALDSTQLNATSGGVAGTFVYSPVSGTVLNAGTAQTLSVTFNPTDTTLYNPATATTTINVTQAGQTITFGTAPSLTYGGLPGSVGATADSLLPVTVYGTLTPGVCTVSGSTVTPVTAGTCTISADQAGNNNYLAAPQKSLSFTIVKATPAITWAIPAAITYGTPLSATQLNASANVAGSSFVYSPVLGTVLGNGPQNLSVTFSPTDTANYTSANTSVSLTVLPTVQIPGSLAGYDTLSAILLANAITKDSTIQLRDVYTTATAETLLFNNGFIVTISGGLDAGWLPTANLTKVKGTLTVQSGKLIVSGLIIKQP
jgi:hypothetical protein